jgi:hypothetical protein
MRIKEYDLPEAQTIKFNAIKQGFESRSNYPKTAKGLKDAIRHRPQYISNFELEACEAPGINPYKQVALWTNYGENEIIPRSFAAVTCPKPPPEIFKIVEDEKKDRSVMKLKKKAAIKSMKAAKIT